MPTALRLRGFRFFFFSREGTEPPHIHIERDESYAKFWLHPVSLAEKSWLSHARADEAAKDG
jgi:hypothetical protein